MLPNYSQIVKDYVGDREEIAALNLRCDLDRMLYEAYMAGMKDAHEYCNRHAHSA